MVFCCRTRPRAFSLVFLGGAAGRGGGERALALSLRTPSFSPPLLAMAGSTRVTADPPPAMVDDAPGPSGRTADKRPNSTSPERALKRAKAVRLFFCRSTHAVARRGRACPPPPRAPRPHLGTLRHPPASRAATSLSTQLPEDSPVPPPPPTPPHAQNLLLELPSAPTRVAAPLPTPTNAWIAADRPSPPLRGDDKVCETSASCVAANKGRVAAGRRDPPPPGKGNCVARRGRERQRRSLSPPSASAGVCGRAGCEPPRLHASDPRPETGLAACAPDPGCPWPVVAGSSGVRRACSCTHAVAPLNTAGAPRLPPDAPAAAPSFSRCLPFPASLHRTATTCTSWAIT